MHPSGLRPVRVLLYSLLSLKKYSSVSKAQAKNFKIHSTSGMEDVQYVKFNTKIRLVVNKVPCLHVVQIQDFNQMHAFVTTNLVLGGHSTETFDVVGSVTTRSYCTLKYNMALDLEPSSRVY